MIWESLYGTGIVDCDVRFDRYAALSMGCWVASGVGCTLVGASDDGSLLGCWVAFGGGDCTLVLASDDELLLGS